MEIFKIFCRFFFRKKNFFFSQKKKNNFSTLGVFSTFCTFAFFPSRFFIFFFFFPSCFFPSRFFPVVFFPVVFFFLPRCFVNLGYKMHKIPKNTEKPRKMAKYTKRPKWPKMHKKRSQPKNALFRPFSLFCEKGKKECFWADEPFLKK